MPDTREFEQRLFDDEAMGYKPSRLWEATYHEPYVEQAAWNGAIDLVRDEYRKANGTFIEHPKIERDWNAERGTYYTTVLYRGLTFGGLFNYGHLVAAECWKHREMSLRGMAVEPLEELRDRLNELVRHLCIACAAHADDRITQKWFTKDHAYVAHQWEIPKAIQNAPPGVIALNWYTFEFLAYDDISTSICHYLQAGDVLDGILIKGHPWRIDESLVDGEVVGVCND